MLQQRIVCVFVCVCALASICLCVSTKYADIPFMHRHDDSRARKLPPVGTARRSDISWDTGFLKLLSLFSSFALLQFLCKSLLINLLSKYRLREFEDRVLRRILGPRRDEVRGERRKLCKERLSDTYCSPNMARGVKSRIVRWAWYVARVGESRVVYRVLVRKAERKGPLTRPRRRWEGNIKMDL